MATLKQTPKGQSYWKSTGIYQKEYDELFANLVPDRGKCKTLNGELIRSISRLSHEYFNNGNCNARVEDGVINTFYEKFLDLIVSHVPSAYAEVLIISEYIREEAYECSLVDAETQTYNALCDKVIHHVLEHDDYPYTGE